MLELVHSVKTVFQFNLTVILFITSKTYNACSVKLSIFIHHTEPEGSVKPQRYAWNSPRLQQSYDNVKKIGNHFPVDFKCPLMQTSTIKHKKGTKQMHKPFNSAAIDRNVHVSSRFNEIKGDRVKGAIERTKCTLSRTF